MTSPQSHLRRAAALFARFGETVTLIRAGGNVTLQALLTPMDGGAAATYFDANETVGLTRPALCLYLDGAQANPPVVTDAFFRDGREWTVRKTATFREGDTAILLLALCD